MLIPNEATMREWMSRVNAHTSDTYYYKNWELHRAGTMSLVNQAIQYGTSSPEVLIVGAGNCNDIDLVELISTSAKVDLVDIDGHAIEQAINRRVPYHLRDKVEVISTDITPLSNNGFTPEIFCKLLASRSVNEFTDAMSRFCVSNGSERFVGNKHYDVVIILPVLTQLIGPMYRACSEVVWRDDRAKMHDDFYPEIYNYSTTLSRQVLDYCWERVRPSGTFVITTDVLDFSEDPWKGTFSTQSTSNPYWMRDMIKSAMEIAIFDDAETILEWLDYHKQHSIVFQRWLWPFSENKIHAVFGELLRK
ncbi:hypothetical protein [Alicyclobacillus sp. SO9]|uniref:hypothetical protein n=1 Tax=Alicyclobacillus sp. SO9 TaxID=2665646 RepID=UPI0018E7737C|nr:hypothetical protein [Alicyclobacillus sp. SO9]